MRAVQPNRTLACFLALGILSMVWLAGCGQGSTSPTSPPPAVSLRFISVAPPSASVATGGTQQFSAVGTFNDNSRRDITNAASTTWMSDNATVATISGSGLATGRGQGTASISARDNSTGVTSNAAILTVGPPTLVSITVTPANQMIQPGQNLQFAATGTLSDGSFQSLTSAVNWTSSNTAVASVSNAPGSQGLATTSANMTGMTVITATDPATMVKGTANLTTATVASIAITSVSPSVSIGAADQLTATGTFSNGVTMDISSSVVWSLGCTPAYAATIDNNGLATGQAVGTCNVTASNSTGSVTSPVFVLTVTQIQLCANATAIYYHGVQAGGDRFEACISRGDSSFSLLDQTTKAVANQGNFTPNSSYSDLLNLTATTPVSGMGNAVEMPSTVLLVNPGTMKTRTNNPVPSPMVMGFEQTGFCPSAGRMFRFVVLPQPNWMSSQAAYGTVAINNSTVTINGSALNGTPVSSETDPFSCDPGTSLLTFTNATATTHLPVSPAGLFGAIGTNQIMAALPQASSSVSFGVGDVYLGIIYEPNTATPTRVAGFRVTSTSPISLSGFDPATSANNGTTISLGSESSFGLFTNGTFVESSAADANLVVIAAVFGGKNVFYGVTFDTQHNTPVALSLLQQ